MAKKSATSLLKTGATAMVMLSALGVSEAVAVTGTLPILVRLVNSLEITINTSMDFGTLAMTEDQAGHATLDPAADRLFIEGNSSLSLAGGVPRVGRIQLKGVVSPVNVSMENETVQLTNGTTAVTVSNFNFMTNNAGHQITVTPLDGDRTAVLNVGATIRTKQGQLTGSYVGSNRIFANYQ